MCSIVGLVNRGREALPDHAQATIDHLLKSTAHRGPDGSGSFRLGQQAVLGANRLAIVDRSSPEASMPMLSEQQDVALVLNGEIYNHNQLRAELAGSYRFRSGSDAEVALAAYLRFGSAFLQHLHGMFAIVVSDRRSGETLACVDRMGEKPLYVLRNDGFMVFSSELSALVSSPHLVTTIAPGRVAESSLLRFSLSWGTPYEEIDRLKPGEVLTISGRGGISSSRYWQLPVPPKEPRSLDPQGMRALVEKICDETLAADEPIGVLLSGGLDSTIITHCASRLGREVHTFSIGFRAEPTQAPDVGIPLDEFRFSREVAAHYGTTHHELTLSSDDYWDYFCRWTELQADPQGVEEAPCLLRLCEEASRFTRIIACGSGADEVLEGYGHAQWLSAGTDEGSQALLLEYLHKCSWFGDCDPRRVCPSEGVLGRVAIELDRVVGPYLSEAKSRVDAVQYINTMTRLNAYELRQMDLASMAWGVEARSPLSDVRFIEAALACPDSQKYSGGIRKRILVEAFTGVVPEAVTSRRKEGFPVPLYLAFTSRFEAMVAELLSGASVLESLEVFDFAYLRELWKLGTPGARLVFFRLVACEQSLQRHARICLSSRSPSHAPVA